MALPSSGTISMSDVNEELDESSTANISLNDADVRDLAEISSGTISMSDLHGKSAYEGVWSGSSYSGIGNGFGVGLDVSADGKSIRVRFYSHFDGTSLYGNWIDATQTYPFGTATSTATDSNNNDAHISVSSSGIRVGVNSNYTPYIDYDPDTGFEEAQYFTSSGESFGIEGNANGELRMLRRYEYYDYHTSEQYSISSGAWITLN